MTLIDPAKCAHYPEIASSKDDCPFGLNPQHVEEGWSFRTQQVEKLMDLGCMETCLHMWDGRSVEEGFVLDMKHHLYAAGGKYAALFDTFADSWGPLIDKGLKLSVYCGRFESKSLLALRDIGSFVTRVLENLEPILQLRLQTHWDASAPVRYGSREHQILVFIGEITGKRVGIEAWPIGSPHWQGHQVTITEPEYLWQTQTAGALPLSKVGRVIRIINKVPHSEMVAAHDRINAAGHTTAVDLLGVPTELLKVA